MTPVAAFIKKYEESLQIADEMEHAIALRSFMFSLEQQVVYGCNAAIGDFCLMHSDGNGYCSSSTAHFSEEQDVLKKYMEILWEYIDQYYDSYFDSNYDDEMKRRRRLLEIPNAASTGLDASRRRLQESSPLSDGALDQDEKNILGTSSVTCAAGFKKALLLTALDGISDEQQLTAWVTSDIWATDVNLDNDVSVEDNSDYESTSYGATWTPRYNYELAGTLYYGETPRMTNNAGDILGLTDYKDTAFPDAVELCVKEDESIVTLWISSHLTTNLREFADFDDKSIHYPFEVF